MSSLFFVRRLRWCLLPTLALALTFMPAPSLGAAEPLQLVASIKPLQLIAQAVAGDQLAVELLVDPRQSHHDYHLRPSDRARLARADLVIWVGPALESYLNRTMRSLAPTRVLTLAPELPGDGGHRHDRHQDAVESDGHIWLDPVRTVTMAQQIADELGRLAPAQRAVWQRNVKLFAQSMKALDDRVAADLSAIEQPHSYLVMHDAYGHFEQHYGLQRTGTYSATPEQQPGVRHFSSLARAIDEGAIGCVFSEPQFKALALDRLLQKHPAIRMVELDLMASDIAPDAAGFGRFFTRFAAAFASCLRP